MRAKRRPIVTEVIEPSVDIEVEPDIEPHVEPDIEPEVELESESVDLGAAAHICQGCTELRNLLEQSASVSSHTIRCVIDENFRLKEQIGLLRKENSELKDKIYSLHTYATGVEKSISQKCATLTERNEILVKDIDELKEKNVWSDKMLCNDAVVKFLTGLPNSSTFQLVVEFISKGLHFHHKAALSPCQEMLLVLMKLRLNLEHQDLAYRFHVSVATITRLFHKWLTIMGERLKPLIRWPSRGELYTTMPMEFRLTFPKCVCVIDCTEVFIVRPSDLKARAQTWSNYKQHNTIKILIAVSPQGTISYISKAWGGRVSDKYITEHCGVLDKLINGDLILADRGFTISDSVGLYCAEVKTPPFTKGRKQLTRCEIDQSRAISHVRIHVERIIGVLKQKYKLFCLLT